MDTDTSDADTNPGEIAVDEPADVPEELAEHSIEFESRFTDMVVIESFPFGNPGAPIPGVTQGPTSYDSFRARHGDSIWAPFKSKWDWDLAHWVKTERATSSAVGRLLPIIGVSAASPLCYYVPNSGHKVTELSYRTVKQLNRFIDKKLPGRPAFERKEVDIGPKTLEFYCRSTLECIKSLFGDPQYAKDLVFVPERHYSSPERKSRLYHKMYTGDWWWETQVRPYYHNDLLLIWLKETLELRRPGATIIPVIISSDKTQLTLFREKQAYPIYLTIGNIPKHIRRKPSRMAHILIGYIPTTKLPWLTNKAARRRALANLFHACMRDVLQPITELGENGVAMMGGDGVWRRCHPIFANFVGDYPEQALVTCTYFGRCPKCVVTPDQLGEYQNFPPHQQRLATDTYLLADEEPRVFHAACRDTGLKPVYHPFWESLPLTDIFLSVTPDILHQLLQGVMKHLVGWIVRIFGNTEINARCGAMPPNHNILPFSQGIPLSRVSGHEHKKMCGILLGLVVDLPIPGGWDSTRLVRAVRALLDFLFLAQYQCHTSETIDQMQHALSEFHDHKSIFVDLGIRNHFNIPKVHSLIHYAPSIRQFGTTDNYNTEQSERLHIDFVKEAYRATNHKDIYSQMTTWLQRREKILIQTMNINQRQCEDLGQPQTRRIPEPPCVPTQTIKMTLHPTKSASFDVLAHDYGAIDFQDALADFLAHLNNPGASASTLREKAANTLIPFRRVPVFHNIKFTQIGHSGESEITDAVHVQPEVVNLRTITPARFDTVIVHQDSTHDRGTLSKSPSDQNWTPS